MLWCNARCCCATRRHDQVGYLPSAEHKSKTAWRTWTLAVISQRSLLHTNFEVFYKNRKTPAVSTTNWMIETQLCKRRDTSQCFTINNNSLYSRCTKFARRPWYEMRGGGGAGGGRRTYSSSECELCGRVHSYCMIRAEGSNAAILIYIWFTYCT